MSDEPTITESDDGRLTITWPENSSPTDQYLCSGDVLRMFVSRVNSMVDDSVLARVLRELIIKHELGGFDSGYVSIEPGELVIDASVHLDATAERLLREISVG